MNDALLGPSRAKEMTGSITEALARQHLRRYVRRIWVYQQQSLVVDFAYRQIRFGIDFSPLPDGRLAVDLVRRGDPQGFSVTNDSKKKNRLTNGLPADEAIAAAVEKIGALIVRIDAHLAENARTATASRRKVGILTLPLGKNYGGNLQAYALMQTVRDLGCDPLLINRRYVIQNPTQRPQPEITAPITNRIDLETDCDNRAFIESHILPITRSFRNSAQLKKHLADYDLAAVIAGSDQVWRPKYARGLLMDFFHGYLEGQDRSIRRISYAASFGADKWEFSEEQTRKAAELIARFDAVSVREDGAAGLCRTYLGVDARHVLDPTLLLTPERYRALFADRLSDAPGRRITSYVLNPSPEKLRLMDAISARLSMPVLPTSSRRGKDGQPLRDTSVEGWLAAFYQADFVLTDSFHGVAFSILFNKPFIAFANPQRGMARFTSILKMFGLEDRLVVDAGSADLEQLLQPVDWLAVNRRLDGLREGSVGFLRDALGLPSGNHPKPRKPVRKVPSGTSQAATRTTRHAVFDNSNPLKVMCTGCGVCVSESQGSLRMDWNKDGFWTPKAVAASVPSQAVRVCPFNPVPEAPVKDEDALGRIFHADAAQSHPRGGYFENTYIGYSNEFRPTSSSGGISTYVFEQLLRRKELDYLFIVRGDAERGYRYQVFRDAKDITSISKTRYFPVTLEELFSVIGQTKGRVGVSGVACFIKAIRLKQYYHPELRERIPFLIGIICGGLKSRHYTDFLAGSAGIEGSYHQPQYRVKNPEGEANDYSFSAIDAGRNTHQVRMRRLGDMWGSGLFKNKACDFCTDVLTELADISLGDAWIPEYNRDGMGNSVIVTRSPLADRIIREGMASGDLTVKEAPMDLILRSQSGGVNHKLNALKFRLWISRNFTDLPVPACRTRLEKEVAAADMLVQVLRERVRSNSLRFWREADSLDGFNRRMRTSREDLQRVTWVRKKQPDAVYAALVAALLPDHSKGRHQTDIPEIRSLIRWLQRKLHRQELHLNDLQPLLPEAQKIEPASLPLDQAATPETAAPPHKQA